MKGEAALPRNYTEERAGRSNNSKDRHGLPALWAEQGVESLLGLAFKGKELLDKGTLSAYDITPDSTLNVIVKPWHLHLSEKHKTR